MDTERKPFKDWFDSDAARQLSRQIRQVEPTFIARRFQKMALSGIESLEFSQRVQQFSDALAVTLPDDIRQALRLLTQSLPRPLPSCESVTDGWLQWPVGQFIADHGLEHFEVSFRAMQALTQCFTSEFAVRPFVERYPEKTIKRLTKLAKHSSPHVRRWCSEGVRSRLPWGAKLKGIAEDPAVILPILEILKDDPEIYVRRSVANNVNDISKDHPQLAIDLCRAWNKGAGEDRRWVINHGLRTLIKSGEPKALSIVGYKTPKNLAASIRVSPVNVSLGEKTTLSLSIENNDTRKCRLLIDYVVHFVRKKGTTEKVFKWTSRELAAGETLVLSKQHAFRPTTVRTLYPGVHKIELQVNGVRLAEASIRLRT